MATKTKITKNDRIDLDMAMGLIGNSLLSDGGLQQMKSMMGAAKDPSAVLGQMVYHVIGTTKDKLAVKGMDVSPKIWAARGGVVDQTIAEAAKVIAGVGNSPQILNRNVLESARQHVMQAFHQEERQNGRPGDPTHPDNADNADAGGNADNQSGDEEQAYSGTPDQDADDNEYQSVMPGAEAGGNHGPNRMPVPNGLLGGG